MNHEECNLDGTLVFVCLYQRLITSLHLSQAVFTDQGQRLYWLQDRLKMANIIFAEQPATPTPRRYGYGVVSDLYDELLGLAHQTVDANGSIHISEAIQWGEDTWGQDDFFDGRTEYDSIDRGKGEFEDYVNSLEKGSASFSIVTQVQATQFGYGEGFVPANTICAKLKSRKGSVRLPK